MKKTILFMLIVFTIALQGQNKLLSSVSEYYDGFSWENSGGVNYEYDSNNNLISETYFSWDNSSNKWENSGKTTYTYNSNNKSTVQLYQSWNSTTNLYENEYRTAYLYNSSGNAYEILTKKWNGSQWVDEDKSDLFYNSNNLINSYNSYTWNGAQWVDDSKGTLGYNSNNKVISSTDEDWNGLVWENRYRTFLNYNGNNKIDNEVGEDWIGNLWVNDYTTNYNYDSNGNLDFYIDSYSGGQYKTKYNYDTSKLMSNFAHPFKDKTGIDYIFEEYPFVNKIISEDNFSYNNATNSYDYDYKTTYNYDSSITLSTDKFEKIANAVKVFPNPSKDYIQVSGISALEPYEISSALGAQVIKGSVAENQSIDIKNLANGIYFMKFKNGNTIKFIKK